MKSHQEESRTDRVNTGGKPGNDKVKGGIEPLEVEAFKRRIKEGDRLYCYRPRRKGDDEVILEKMSVIKPHEHIVTMAYHGVRGNAYETSMTWGEAIQLNRMTQKQLAREVARMRKEMGIVCPDDSNPKKRKSTWRPQNKQERIRRPNHDIQGKGNDLCTDILPGGNLRQYGKGNLHRGGETECLINLENLTARMK